MPVPEVVVELRYVAPEACPDRAAFLRAVTSRARGRAVVEAPASSAGVAGAAPSPARWEVVLARGPAGVVGRFGVGVPGGRQEVREVVERGCEEVVDALALVAAMTLVEAPEPGPEPEPGPLVPTPSGAPPSASDRADAARAPDRAEGAEHRAIAPFVAVGGRGRLLGGVSPAGVVGGAAAYVEVGVLPRSVLAPSVRLGVLRTAETAVVASNGGRASFVLTSGTFDACPARVRRTPLEVAACARLEVGALAGEGTRVVPARSETRTWAALGALLEARVAVAGPLGVAVEGGASAPLARPTFAFQPALPVHEPPAVAGFVGAGADVRFP